MADINEEYVSKFHCELPQSYEEYAGYFTPEMLQRAIDGGCETYYDMQIWLAFNYSRDQNYGHGPVPYRFFRRKRKKPIKGDFPLRPESAPSEGSTP
jgi:hypothetical protein